MALRQNKYRYELVTWYERNADALLAVFDHFTPDAATSQEILADVIRQLIGVWPAVDASQKKMRRRGVEPAHDPHHTAAAWVAYDTLTRRYRPPTSPPPPQNIAERGAWTPLYESDRWLASTLLWNAEAIPSRVDWILLHILTKLEISDTAWAQQVQAPPAEESARLRYLRMSAFELLTAVQLETESFQCEGRPRLPWSPQARPLEMVMSEHRMACRNCETRAQEYVSPPHLIAGSVRHEVTLSALRRLWVDVEAQHNPTAKR